MLLRFLFGDDVFISYSRRDGANYAAALANELSRSEHGFSCFLDQWGASAASELSAPVVRALDRSAVLVLVGTPGAAESAMVREEVRRFSQPRRFRPHRPVLPVNINGAFDRVSWTELTGLHRTVDSEEARRDGLPSEPVIRLIRNSHTFARRNQRVRWLSIGAAVLLIASAGASAAAVTQRRRAVAEARRADESRQESERQAAKAVASATRAQQKESEATANAERARQQTELAETNAKKADEQLVLTERQTTIAQARLIATQASLAREQAPGLLPRSVLLGVEAMRRFPAAETERALRPGVALLPRPIATLRHVDDDVVALAFGPDGRDVATAGRARALRLWQPGTNAVSETPAMYSDAFGPLAMASLSPDLQWFTVATRDGVRVWNVAARKPLGEPIRIGREVTAVALSPDGRRVAVGAERLLRIWDVTTVAVVADLAIDAQLSGNVTALAFSPDGTRLYSGWRDLVQVWDARTGAMLRSLRHPAAVSALAVSPNGTYLATAGGRIAIFKSETGEAVASFEHSARTVTFAWSRDERLLAAGAAEEPAVQVWKIEDAGAERAAAFAHAGGVSGLAFGPDGHRLVSGSADGTARVWDVVQSREILRIAHGERVQRVAFSPDGRSVATAGAASTRLWDSVTMADGTPLPFDDFRKDVAFGPRGEYVAALAGPNLDCWDVATGDVAHRDFAEEANAATLSPDGRFVALVSGRNLTDDRDNAVRVIDARSGRDVARLAHDGPRDWEAIRQQEAASGASYRSYDADIVRLQQRGTVVVNAFSPDGRYLVTSSIVRAQRVVRVWLLDGSRELARIEVPYLASLDTLFSPDGTLVAVTVRPRLASLDQIESQIWRVADGRELPQLRKAGDRPVAFTPDGRRLVTSRTQNRVGTVTVWEVSSGRMVSSFQQQDQASQIQVSPDGRYLLSRDVASFAHVHDVATGRELPFLKQPVAGPVVFSRDGRYLATGRQDHVARGWELTVREAGPWTAIATFTQEAGIRSLAFSPDSRHVAAVVGDGARLQIWDVKTRSEVAGITIGEGGTDAAFSPDGRHIVTAHGDRTARVWLWRPDDLIAAACARVPASLAPEEWRFYFPGEPLRPTCAAK